MSDSPREEHTSTTEDRAALDMARDWLQSTTRERASRRMQATPLIQALTERVVQQAEEIARLEQQIAEMVAPEELYQWRRAADQNAEEIARLRAALMQAEESDARNFKARITAEIRADNAESQVQALREALEHQDTFIARCRELRYGSPNAFYAHVDAYCKQAGSPVTPAQETQR